MKKHNNQIDKSIPFKNIIMRCDNYDIVNISNSNFKIRNYQDGDEQFWSNIEYSIGDFDSEREARKYFVRHYNSTELYERCFFAEDDKGNIVGTCTAWYDNKENNIVSSLHWLAVLPEYQNQGIGRLLVLTVMNYYKQNDLLPVYLHTQPWSYKAITLYSSIGFKILKEDTFANYINEYDNAIKVLGNYLPLSNLKIE